MKTCTTCKIQKPLTDFPKGRGQCKPCYSQTQRARRVRDADKIKERHRAYYVKNKDRARENYKEYYEKNRETLLEYARQYRSNPENRERIAARKRERLDISREQQRVRRLAKYGVTPEQYDEWLRMFDGACHICKQKPSGDQVLDIDHCHVNGHARGLLCQLCNKAIGLLRDDIMLLNEAIKYLRERSTTQVNG